MLELLSPGQGHRSERQGSAELEYTDQILLTVGFSIITTSVRGNGGNLVRSVVTGHAAVLNACRQKQLRSERDH